MSWMSKLREVQGAVPVSVPFGWHAENGEPTGFAYGAKMFRKDGTTRKAEGDDRVLARIYAPHGALDPWLRVCRLITDQKRPELDAVVATAFAAPLLSLIGAAGACVPVVGPTGCGKSTALEVAVSVWGHPRHALETRATGNGSIVKLAHLRHLPVYWDETHTPQAQSVVFDLMMALSHSNSGTKLTIRQRIGEVRDNQTIMTTASTRSFWSWVVNSRSIKKDANDAGLYRLFEIAVGKPLITGPGQLRISQAQLIKAQMVENYGTMGLAYAKMLGHHPDKAKAETLAAMQWFEQEVSPERTERFWISLAAALLAGATFGNELGCQFDLARLRGYLANHIVTLRQRIAGLPVDATTIDDTAEILRAFLEEHLPHSIWSERMVPTNRQGNAVRGFYMGIRKTPAPGLPAHVHYGLNNRLIIFSFGTLRTYMEDHKIKSQHSVVAGLKSNFNVSIERNRSFGKGTPYARKYQRLYVLPVPEGSWMEKFLFACLQDDAEQVA